MKTKYTVENLSPSSVAVRSVTMEGDKIVSQSRKCFCNTETGRKALCNMITKTQYKDVIKIWGKEPTKK